MWNRRDYLKRALTSKHMHWFFMYRVRNSCHASHRKLYARPSKMDMHMHGDISHNQMAQNEYEIHTLVWLLVIYYFLTKLQLAEYINWIELQFKSTITFLIVRFQALHTYNYYLIFHYILLSKEGSQIILLLFPCLHRN